MSSTQSDKAPEQTSKTEKIEPVAPSLDVKVPLVRMLKALIDSRRESPNAYVATSFLRSAAMHDFADDDAEDDAITEEQIRETFMVINDLHCDGRPATEEDPDDDELALRLHPDTPSGMFEDLVGDLITGSQSTEADEAPESAEIDFVAAKKAVRLFFANKEAQARADATEKAWKKASADAGEDFLLANCDGIVVDGYLLWLNRSAGHVEYPGGTDAAIVAIKASPHAAIVKETANLQTMGALLREMDDGDVPAIPEWKEVILYVKTPKMGVRKAK